jgi:hypothetical protein
LKCLDRTFSCERDKAGAPPDGEAISLASSAIVTAIARASGYSNSVAVVSPGVLVSATLLDGSGNPQTSARLHFQLWNCGNNVPQVVGAPQVVVGAQFDIRANPTTELISGWIYGNNQISCGNVQSSQWLVRSIKTAGKQGRQRAGESVTG